MQEFSYIDTSLVLSITHSRGNTLASMFGEKRNGAIAPGREIGDSSKKLLSNKCQILKIKSPFRGFMGVEVNALCCIKAMAGCVHLQY